ncbi:MAG TPA: rhodanese-like domain-containing protein [Pyrinomonadaceae bacterium]|nr:rhodanese-like domain-containing protein [Pyrinomonadaceae bacterium]
MRFILSITAFIVVGSIILTGCNNASAPKPVETTKTNAVNTANTTNTNPAQKVDSHGHVDNAERITLTDAKKDFDGGNAVFIDTRDDASFKQEHIKGSLNIPMNLLNERFGTIPKGKKVIAYCS